MAELVRWGSINIMADRVIERLFRQVPERLATGPDAQRQDLMGSLAVKVSDFSGGLIPGLRILSWTRDLNRYAYNEGLQTHIPGGLYLPYVLQSQATLTAINASGYRAANTRAHGFNTNLGQSLLRYGAGIGTAIYVTTSDTDHTLVSRFTSTDKVLSARELIWASARGMTFGFNGATDDIQYTTDITANPLTFTKAVTLSADDQPWAMENMQNIGPGFNLVCGTIAGTRGIYYAKQSEAVPVTLTRMVSTATRTVVNPSNASVTTAARSSLGEIVTASSTGGGTEDWSNVSNIRASDNAYMTRAAPAAANTYDSQELSLKGFGFAIPAGSVIIGILATIEAKISSTTGVTTSGFNGTGYVRLYLGDTAVSAAKTNSSNLTTSDASYTFGGAGDVWDADIDVATVTDETFSLRIRASTVRSGAGGAATISIDAVTITVTYIPPGTALDLPTGGFLVGKLPSSPSRIALVAPISNDPTAVTVPRELWYLDCSYDSTGDRMTGELSKPNTGLDHIEDATPFMGGVMCAGDTSSGVGKSLKHVDSAGTVRNLNFPGTHGTAAVGIVSCTGMGSYAILDVAHEDGTDAQGWYYYDGTYHASMALQDKSSAISSIPIAWAEKGIGIQLRRFYRFYPVSTTHLAASRTFVPRNIFDDPLVANLTEAKQDGPMFLRMHELTLGGPEEGNNAITYLRAAHRHLSAVAGSYGTVLIEVDTGGDTTLGTPEITTGGLDAAFEEYLVPSSGVAMRTAIMRITLDNDGTSGDSLKTPNGIPYIVGVVADWPMLRAWTVYPDNQEIFKLKYQHWSDFVDDLIALADTKVVQRFRIGRIDKPASVAGFGGGFVMPSDAVTPPEARRGEEPFVTFAEKRGQTSA